MKLRNVFSLIAVVALTFGSEILVAQASAPDDAVMIIPSDMPLTFLSVAVEPEPGRQLSKLNYTVKNTSERTINSFTIGAYIAATNGKCLTGEVWTIAQQVPPNSARAFSTTLKNYVGQDTRLAVVFTSTRDETSLIKADAAQIKKALTQISGADVIGQSPSLETVQPITSSAISPTPASSCDPGFCTDSRTAAVAICLGENCQLGGFSCSQSTCSYAFTCRCCTGGHCQ